jgi:hypothetical protein
LITSTYREIGNALKNRDIADLFVKSSLFPKLYKSEKVRGHKDGINYRHQTDIDENAVDD